MMTTDGRMQAVELVQKLWKQIAGDKDELRAFTSAMQDTQLDDGDVFRAITVASGKHSLWGAARVALVTQLEAAAKPGTFTNKEKAKSPEDIEKDEGHRQHVLKIREAIALLGTLDEATIATLEDDAYASLDRNGDSPFQADMEKPRGKRRGWIRPLIFLEMFDIAKARGIPPGKTRIAEIPENIHRHAEFGGPQNKNGPQTLDERMMKMFGNLHGHWFEPGFSPARHLPGQKLAPAPLEATPLLPSSTEPEVFEGEVVFADGDESATYSQLCKRLFAGENGQA